jgi:hypothetical protein
MLTTILLVIAAVLIAAAVLYIGVVIWTILFDDSGTA